ncbi:MAG: transcription-repair coupling factor [Clostridiales bacterium]|nr:transcription-repair coupling factor [Clostridiales bacterium]
MKGIYEPIHSLSSYKTLRARIARKEAVLVSGIGDSVQNHLSAALTEERKGITVILTPNDVKAQAVYEDMRFYFPGETFYFPAKDPLFYSADTHGSMIEESRIKVLKALLEYKVRVLVMSVEALYDRMIPVETWQQYILHRRLGRKLDPEKATEQLVRMGYERLSQIEHAGQFAVRGSIIDIFPLTDDTALRIELWDDEIDSIRVLDVETQRSLHRLEDFTVYPAAEILLSPEIEKAGLEKIRNEAKSASAKLRKEGMEEEADRVLEIHMQYAERLENGRYRGMESYIPLFYGEEAACILDYLPDDTLLVLEEPGRIREKTRVLEEELNNSVRGRMEKGYLLPSQMDMFPHFPEVEARMAPFGRISLCSLLASNQAAFPVKEILTITSRSVNLAASNERMLLDELRTYNRLGYRTLLLAESGTRAKRLLSRLIEEDIAAYEYKDTEDGPAVGSIGVAKGGLAQGFVYTEIGFAVIAQKELARGRERSKKRRKRFKGGQQIKSFGELTVGDYVVHENHGVGIYHGIVQMDTDTSKRDYFKIVYKDGGVLYVPTTSLDMLQRYAGGEDAKPKLNKLGGNEWNRTKRKVKEGVAKLAEDLVKLYAEREEKKGFIYSPDTVWQQEFEEMFPFEETADQLSAIEDIKHDMEAGRIMDRLICGDVGFGKTEVAIRAAFKAVQDGKQVAYLAPTTILAQQHYNTFSGRMRDYPVRVELLSRFRSKKEIDEAIKETKRGAVDILIGTHRLLSADVAFKDLGLLIIDEEQRFGVSHKEKIKALKKDVDVLTLTATPIPRTLHMSLNGIRDMSVLEEPPLERQPIQTFVMEEEDELVREAIYREIGRGGQVFFLHNRVQNIDETTIHVQALVPEARVAFAHGQMSERELENVMMRFVEGEIDVLVCTTIIETGMDISNVNTILIENADTMGLAQLYQLRGRVGRSNRVAYAYFLYRKGKVLQEVAQKRLEAVGEFTEFGSGFKIAMRDLEIRGAGNVLGPEQHGHMGAVGYDLYCKLLEQAMADVRGEVPEETFETTVTISLDAFIPSTYIANESQKLEVYKKIAQIQNEEDYQDMLEELIDRYSDPPKSVQNLVTVSYIKALGNHLGAEAIELKGQILTLTLRDQTPLDPQLLTRYMLEHARQLSMQTTPKGTKIMIRIEPVKKESILLDRIIKALKDMQPLIKEGHA